MFHETDETVNIKIKAALRHGITPICCIGERLEQREAGKTFNMVEAQVKAGFEGLTAAEMARVVIAYEPVWAIGTGHTATPEQANEVHAFIRKTLAGLFDNKLADRVARCQMGNLVSQDHLLLLPPEALGKTHRHRDRGAHRAKCNRCAQPRRLGHQDLSEHTQPSCK